MNKTPKISVIVPVYKAEKYLHRCVDCILNQTFTDFEVLLIDDGSPDRSGEICDEYAKKDSRVRVFHKENGGVSSARNVGLKHAVGEWIYFIDPDDYLFKKSFDILTSGISDNIEMVLAGYNEVSLDGEVLYSETARKNQVIDIESAVEIYFTGGDYKFQGYLWNRLFRNDIIQQNGLIFNESIYYKEDGLFVVQYMCRMKKSVKYTTEPIYNYVIHEDGAMGSLSKGVTHKFLTNLDARIITLNEIRSRFSRTELVSMAKQAVFGFQFWVYAIMRQHNSLDYKILCKVACKTLFSINIFSYVKYLSKVIIKKIQKS